MTNQSIFEEYTDFTETEVTALCKRFNMSFAKTNNWYDGHKFRRFQHIYNPRSVVSVINREIYKDVIRPTSMSLKNALKSSSPNISENATSSATRIL